MDGIGKSGLLTDGARAGQSFPTVSSLLQERLERERRPKSRHAFSPVNNETIASASTRVVQSLSPTEAQRPESSGETGGTSKKGWSIKEMEHTLSTLHKQNFDLKLELYHRREKQTAMEERLEELEERFGRLESEKLESEVLNERLVHEIEKRDKALEEAVAMIVGLEARIDLLLREREMVRQVEADASPFSRTKTPAARTQNMAIPELSKGEELKKLMRTPSFVREPVEKTENLRNVYLNARESSILSLPCSVEETPETTRIQHRLDSPVPSILSESSFVSIYGRNRTTSNHETDDSHPAISAANDERKQMLEDTPSRSPRLPASHSAGNGSSQFRNISDVLDIGSSPLQRLEKLGVEGAMMKDAPEVHISLPSTNHNRNHPAIAGRSTSQAKPRTKEEKRQALHKVLTLGINNELQQSRGLPPTPDTMSTSTLRRFEGSNETLSKDRNTPNDNGGALRPTSIEEAAKPRHSPANSLDTWMRESLRPPSLDAVDPASSVSQTHLASGSGRISPDLFSFPSSSAGWAANAMFGSLHGTGVLSANERASPASPMADMLDAIGRSIPSPTLDSDRLIASLVAGNTAPPPPNRRSSLLARTGVTGANGSVSYDNTPQSTSPMSSPLKKGSARGSRARSNSNADARPPTRQLKEMGLAQDRSMTVPPKQTHFSPPPNHNQEAQSQPLPKQRHYPPSSQTSRPRSRGLNGLFRRSTGSADSTQVFPPPLNSPPATETNSKTPSAAPLVGMPSWVRRSSLVHDDDRASVTPPPILRNKATAASHTSALGNRAEHDEDGGVPLGGGGVDFPASGGAATSVGGNIPIGGGGASLGGSAAGAGGGGGGGKLKWLGLGRVGSLHVRR
ncbi:hypothetical protein N656DRAFT_717718 [Canariomyces notabilis]|uniref:Centrosomin N-terminal motif 1 domain-containing protein n=1 Tax=Canariomyces notabilis TaxID=2074819 RepID=A0AAN6QE73_9PEZI|nr:hypothetical protein N656DRAFT_717718 [Canariomyces arenarius]